VQLRATKDGPVISDQFAGFDRPISLRWVGFERGDTSYEALYRLQFASDWKTFREALSWHVTPALNMVYADVEGNIGAVAAGKLPIRKPGTRPLPAPGWDDARSWSGFLPADRLPATYNPASGFIIGANTKVAGVDAPNSTEEGRGSLTRAKRIEQLLKERLKAGNGLNVADMERIQGDVVDLDAAELAAELVKVRPRDDEQAKALRCLMGWNGEMTASSRPAVILSVWAHYLRKRLLEDNFHWYWNKPEQDAYLRSLEQQMDIRTLRQALSECQTVWKTARTEGGTRSSCEDMLQSTLQAALNEIARTSGSRNMSTWKWNAMQHGAYLHQPLGQWQALHGVFERGTAQGGSANTVNAAESAFVDNEGFVQQMGTTFRQVMSLQGSRIVHVFMNSTGQSGNVASPHYADMVETFSRLEYESLSSED
jgi:penicillin amidase